MAPHLPDEILIKVIKQSIEPYRVILESSSRIHDRAQRQDAGIGQNTLSQARHAANLRLANKMFTTEVRRVIRSKFDGIAYIDIHSCDLPSESLISGSDHEWLKHDVVDLQIHGYSDRFEDDADGQVWHPTSIPHLKSITIWLHNRYYISGLNSHPSNFFLMDSFTSEQIDHELSSGAKTVADSFLFMCALPVSLQLAELERRGVKIYLKVDDWKTAGEMVRYSMKVTNLQGPQHHRVHVNSERYTPKPNIDIKDVRHV